MKNVVALVLAGGKIGGFDVLTLNRAKGALPFAGLYRLIDFPLSSLSHSGIDKVGLIIQYLPASMIEHVGIGQSWDFQGFGRILKIMPPFVGVGTTEWFKGTADALFRNLNFIFEYLPRDILVLSGEHIYHTDFDPIIQFHREKNAEITIVGRRGKPEELSSKYGYFDMDENKRITYFEEKPLTPTTNLYSLGIYIFKTDSLVRWLRENDSIPDGAKTNILAYDIIAKKALNSLSYGYEIIDYWNYLEDINVYFLAHRDLLRIDNPIDISSWNVLTNLEDRELGARAPFYAGPNSKIRHSLISAGCAIDGTVEWSVLSPGVIVEKGAEVRDSIIFHDCTIKKGARLNRVVSDKDSVFGEGCTIGEPSDVLEVEVDKFEGLLPKTFRRIPDQGLTIIGKNVTIGREITLKKKCVVYPNMDLTLMYGKTFDIGKRMKPEKERIII